MKAMCIIKYPQKTMSYLFLTCPDEVIITRMSYAAFKSSYIWINAIYVLKIGIAVLQLFEELNTTGTLLF